MSSKSILLAALAAACLVVLPARADVVVLTSGGKVKGRIVKETGRAVHVKNPRGVVTVIPKHEIDRVVRQDFDRELAKRLEAAGEDVERLLEVAQWARDHDLKKHARRCYQRVIAHEPEHSLARERLGYRKVDGKWLRGKALRKALGLVKYKGKWVTPEEKANREAGLVRGKDGRWRAKSVKASARRKRASKSKAAPSSALLSADDQELLRIVASSWSTFRQQLHAVQTLSRRSEDTRAALRRALEERLAKAKKRLIDHFRRGKGKVRAKLARRIVQRRKAALAVIFDTSKYPDANHGAAGQPLVDQLVGRLARAYNDPLAELSDDDQVKKLRNKLTQVSGWLRDFAGGDVQDAALLQEVAGAINEAVDMGRFPVSIEDARVLRQSLAILKRNKAMRTSLNDEERTCILATNEYRMMFGLKALKTFEPLVRAARGHSQDMNRLKFFDHTSRVPGKRTPSQRCKLEGANFSGENIAMGMRQGRAAFRAWYTSSGHHRNMLTRSHRSIGIGQDGKYWTQNFGADNP